jgi:hypothetical protein
MIRNYIPIKSTTLIISDVVSHIGEFIEINIPNDLFTDPENDFLFLSASEIGHATLPSWFQFVPELRKLYGTPNKIEDLRSYDI